RHRRGGDRGTPVSTALRLGRHRLQRAKPRGRRRRGTRVAARLPAGDDRGPKGLSALAQRGLEPWKFKSCRHPFAPTHFLGTRSLWGHVSNASARAPDTLETCPHRPKPWDESAHGRVLCRPGNPCVSSTAFRRILPRGDPIFDPLWLSQFPAHHL